MEKNEVLKPKGQKKSSAPGQGKLTKWQKATLA